MPYDAKNKETAEQLRKRLEREEAVGGGDPTPEEIAARAAAIRAAWVDENGISVISPRNDNQADGREPQKYEPGIREIPASIHRK